jgi:hypothetical protein
MLIFSSYSQCQNDIPAIAAPRRFWFNIFLPGQHGPFRNAAQGRIFPQSPVYGGGVGVTE